MRTIAIINQKGGCGKTTTAINLAAVLARNGKRVLLADMDPQGHCAAGLGIPEQRIELDIGDAMLAIGSRPIDPAKLLWRAVKNVDLAPSRMKLAGLEASRGGLAELPDKDRRLSQVLEKFASEYDIAIVDCPPSIGLLTYNALAAADMVLIPVETSFFSLQGATRQVQTVKTLCKRLGVEMSVWLLATLHDRSNTVATDLLEELQRRFKGRVSPVTVHYDPKLREAASFGQTVIDYAPDSLGAEDYGRLGVWALESLRPKTIVPIERPDGDFAAGLGGVAGSSSQQTSMASNTPITPRGLPTVTVMGSSMANPGIGQVVSEVKPVSRAEDVARRAQEFLRKVAVGKSVATTNTASMMTGPGITGVTGATPTSSSAALPTAAPAAAAARAASAIAQPLPGASATMTQALTTPDTNATAVALQAPRQVLTLIQEAKPLIHPSAQTMLGIRETAQGMLFVQPLTLGRSVAIAASFNGWSPTLHPMVRDESLGIFQLCIKLPVGKFSYRLVVDGKWIADSYNTMSEPNPFGEINSVGYVAGVR